MPNVEVIDTSELGDRSYVVHDGRCAVVIDPQRDVDRIEKLLAERGLELHAVAETHIHNDYVTGGYDLARSAGVDYLVNADDPVSFERRAVSEGDVLHYGGLEVRVAHTPGHTHTHLAYLVTGPEDQVPAVFTGGGLLYGSVGRTDLLGDDQTETLTRAQFHSAHKLAALLPDEAPVYPTHGFGSFCSSGSAAGGDSSTMGEEKSRNDALTAPDEQTFVDNLIANLTAYPAYYAHMGARNLTGPQAPDLSTAAPVDPTALRASVEAGEWVVDLRDRTAYAADHLRGTIGIELGGQFTTYLGWLIPWGTPLTLIGESAEDVAQAQRQLVRIGIERPKGAAVGTIEEVAGGSETLETYPRLSFKDLAKARSDQETLVVLDVRRDDERAQGYVAGSAHVPMHSLLRRLDEVPDGPLWVHCASGFRASVAASLLACAGREVVLVDDEFARAGDAGLQLESPGAEPADTTDSDTNTAGRTA